MPMTKLDEANFNAHLDRHIPRVHTASLGLHKMLGLLEPAIPFPPPPPPPIPPTLQPRHPEPIDPTTSSATSHPPTSKATSTARPPSPQHPGNSHPWWSPDLSTTLQTWSTLLAPSPHRTTALSISFWTLAPHPPRRLAEQTPETARSIQLFSVEIPAHAASAPNGGCHLSGRWLCIQMVERACDTTDCSPWTFLAFPSSIATQRREYMLTPFADGSLVPTQGRGGTANGAPRVCCTELDVDGGGKMPLVDGGGVDPLAWGAWMEAVAMGRGRIVVCTDAGRRLFEW